MLSIKTQSQKPRNKRPSEDLDQDNEDPEDRSINLADEDESRRNKRAKTNAFSPSEVDDSDVPDCDEDAPSPRTIHILSIINSRDVNQIKLLKGVGVKKAEAIVDCLCEMDQDRGETDVEVNNLVELSKLKGVGARTVQSMRTGVLV